MRLELPKTNGAHQRKYAAELSALVGCDCANGPVCRPDCPMAKTRACTPCCPQAPRALTSDETFPIEKGILPLVFELKATAVFEPVWSCEGHYDQSGQIGRRPTIWFCCESLPQTRALAEVVSGLCTDTGSAAAWKISLCCPGHESPNTLFKLEPETTFGMRLEALHTDVSDLARPLRQRLSRFGSHQSARKLWLSG